MIEFFFDCSSPWTYLAFHNIQPLAKEFGVEISWRPILVGGIFNTVNPSVYAQREKPVPLKARYMKKDLADWARSAGLAIKMPPTVFPVNSVKAMRGCIWLGRKASMVPFARAVFETYWGDDKDISQDAVLTEICKRVGIDPQKFFAGIGEQAIKDQLKANTDEVMARGGFGSPTIFVDKTDMYFGNDRLPLIREALQRRKERARPDAEGRRLPRTRSAREPAPGNVCRPRRWRRGRCASPFMPPGSISGHPDGGRRISAQAAVAVHAGRGGGGRRGRGQCRRGRRGRRQGDRQDAARRLLRRGGGRRRRS